MHHEVLRKIIRLNTVILFVESTESHNSYFIIITATADAKTVIKAHRCHCKCNYSTTEGFEDRELHHCNSKLSRI